MSFNSIGFLLFLSAVLVLFRLLSPGSRWIILLISGLVFYALSDLVSLPIIAAIGLISYFGGLILRSGNKKLFQAMLVSILLIALLGLKYSKFFIENISFLRSLEHGFFSQLIAPLGISYVTFQCIGYLVDVQKGKIEAQKDAGLFLTYIFYFPKIIAGPVERPDHFFSAFRGKKLYSDADDMTAGLKKFTWGLFKKICIADRLSTFSAPFYENVQQHSSWVIIFFTLLFLVQLYADFSGYTDMALGISAMFGIPLIDNFDRPLAARSTAELWRRWHISLSTWFNEYVFTPLAINLRNMGIWAPVIASIITFVLLGFWHGPTWGFIVFGLIQGILLSIEVLTQKQRKKLRKKIPKTVNDWSGVIYTFASFSFALIFFKYSDLRLSMDYIGHIAHNWGISPSSISVLVVDSGRIELLLTLLGIAIILLENSEPLSFRLNNILLKTPPFGRLAFYFILVNLILYLGYWGKEAIIYKQF